MMLSEVWRDILAFFGVAVSVAGLSYAIWQIRKTKSAAEAARDAAERTRNENRDAFQRYVAGQINRYLNEVNSHLEIEEWSRVAYRLFDLADQLVHLIPAFPNAKNIIAEVRDFARTSQHIANGRRKSFPHGKWHATLKHLQEHLDPLLVILELSEK